MFHVEHETFHTLSCLACWVVSIHAHVKGATLPIRLTTKTHCFNPRAREGRDSPGRGGRWCRSVSIHAPTSGATVRQTSKPSMSGFQSTRPRRARPQRYIGRSRSRVFQSTRPRGTRPCSSHSSSSSQGFNPRVRAGRDAFPETALTIRSRFNPRVRAGRDAMQSLMSRRTHVSIHASARDATHYNTLQGQSLRFQSTCPRGTRLDAREDEVSEIQFQSTRPRGTRPTQKPTLTCCISFNPGVREGRDPSPQST